MTFPYLIFVISNSDPIPAPTANITGCNLSLLYILSALDFSTFNIFPHNGNIAWNFLSLPCLALPPAESPSTIYISHSSAFLLEQSANFPGKVEPSNAVFLLTNSLAFLAASLALDALIHFSNIDFATFGFSSKKVDNASFKIDCTTPVTSLFPSFVLVCPSNWGSLTFTEITAVIPSLISSPCKFDSFSFNILWLLA